MVDILESKIKLSIIVPIYNVENYIERALTSVCCKKRKDIEIIVVNDGSSDGSNNVANDVLRRFENENSYTVTQVNNGVSSARNRGIAEAKGEYLFFLDGDDYADKDMIKSVTDIIEKTINKPDVVCWGYNKVDSSNKVIMEYFQNYKAGFGALTGAEALKKIVITKELSIWTGSAIYKKDTIIRNGLKYSEGCTNGEDQEFIYKTPSKSRSVIFIDQVLSYYYFREGSITNSRNIKKFDTINALSRTSDYLKAQVGLTEIAEHIRVNRIIEAYISSYISCIHGSPQMNRTIRELNDAIEVNYPGLTNKIKALANEIPTDNMKLKLRIKLLLVSPLLYLIASKTMNN